MAREEEAEVEAGWGREAEGEGGRWAREGVMGGSRGVRGVERVGVGGGVGGLVRRWRLGVAEG